MTEGRWLMAVAQLTSPEVVKEESVEDKVKEAFDQLWGVIVWNDPINLMSYVVYVFQRVLKMSKQDATRHMLEVHNKGKSMVAKETKEKAELLVHQLQGFGLQATMEKT
ncbi:ATP-dependent Clp protease adaptor protein clpS [Methylacidiphilum infernorum V4]|nr:ATP-dependent Clp protease adaptor protein clpS [Methylacidiphilum infernorum V4]